jgi:hypothetical protein
VIAFGVGVYDEGSRSVVMALDQQQNCKSNRHGVDACASCLFGTPAKSTVSVVGPCHGNKENEDSS